LRFFEDEVLVTLPKSCLALDGLSNVVEAKSNVGGVGKTEGSGGNSVVAGAVNRADSSNSVVNNRADSGRVGDGLGNSVVDVGVSGGDNKGGISLSLTLDNVLNSVVLGNVLGSENSVGDSSVVVGVVVVGHLVGGGNNGSGSIRDNWVDVADNRVVGAVGNRADGSTAVGNGVDGSSVVDKSGISLGITLHKGVDIAVKPGGVGHSRSDERSGDGADNRVDNRVDKRADRADNGTVSVVSDGSDGTSAVDNSRIGLRLSISITLNKSTEGVEGVISGGVRSETSQQRRVSRSVGERRIDSRVHQSRIGFRLSAGNGGQSENYKHLHGC